MSNRVGVMRNKFTQSTFITRNPLISLRSELIWSVKTCEILFLIHSNEFISRMFSYDNIFSVYLNPVLVSFLFLPHFSHIPFIFRERFISTVELSLFIYGYNIFSFFFSRHFNFWLLGNIFEFLRFLARLKHCGNHSIVGFNASLPRLVDVISKWLSSFVSWDKILLLDYTGKSLAV